MTDRDFDYLMGGIQVMSPEQLRRLRDVLDRKLAEWAAREEHPLTAEQKADQEAQLRLFQAGILSEIKPPITDLTPYRNREAVPIEGEPLSETVIRERR